jgi:hypothetical protein
MKYGAFGFQPQEKDTMFQKSSIANFQTGKVLISSRRLGM